MRAGLKRDLRELILMLVPEVERRHLARCNLEPHGHVSDTPQRARRYHLYQHVASAALLKL